MLVRKLRCEYVVEDGKELVLTMDCKTDEEFALNWLVIYNNARENKDVFLSCKLYYNSDIIVLVNSDDEIKVKEYLERFGKVRVNDVKYRYIDMDSDYDFDTDYDIIAGEH